MYLVTFHHWSYLLFSLHVSNSLQLITLLDYYKLCHFTCLSSSCETNISPASSPASSPAPCLGLSPRPRQNFGAPVRLNERTVLCSFWGTLSSWCLFPHICLCRRFQTTVCVCVCVCVYVCEREREFWSLQSAQKFNFLRLSAIKTSRNIMSLQQLRDERWAQRRFTAVIMGHKVSNKILMSRYVTAYQM